MIELFVPTFNEEWMLPKMVDFYRKRIKNLVINVYDNGSTDNTVEVAKQLGCIVHYRDTGGQIDDSALANWKSTVWRDSKALWVIVCDTDEWVNVHESWLEVQLVRGYDLIPTEGYNMIDEKNGVPNPMHCKTCVFRPTIQLTYGIGAHTANASLCNPYPNRVHLYHMKYVMPIEMVIERYKNNALRLSEVNKRHGWGFHYTFDEETIRREYAETLLQAKPIYD